MTDIKIPITAPGADTAAAAIDKVAITVESLAKSKQKYEAGLKREAAYQAEVNKQLKEASTAQEVFERRVAKTADRLSKLNDAQMKTSKSARAARADILGTDGGGDPLSNRAQRKLLNMIPGGRIVDDIMDVAGGAKGGARMMAGFGALTGALMVGSAMFDANSKAVAASNTAMLENMKINFDMARQTKATLDTQRSESVKSFGSIRNAARFILGTEGAQGESTVKSALDMGGPTAVTALASLLKTRDKDIKRSGQTGAGILIDVQRIADVTGADSSEILKELSAQKGKYDPDKVIKELTGGLSPEMWKHFSESGAETDLGVQVETYDVAQRKLNKERGKGTLNRSQMAAGLTAEIASVIDPFKKGVDELNAKIQEEIAMKEALMIAQQSLVDFWIDTLSVGGKNPLRVKSVRGQAKEDIKQLEGQLR